MIGWLFAHWGDILVLAVLAMIVVLVIRGMLRDKKKGKCCGGCTGCAMSGACQRENS